MSEQSTVFFFFFFWGGGGGGLNAHRFCCKLLVVQIEECQQLENCDTPLNVDKMYEK